MISVVCPTFNSANYINNCLESILNQTLAPKEVIISDDGSSDNTIKIVKNYNEIFSSKKIRLIIIEGNHEGPGAARNKGIMASNERWISFIDSDDTWDISKLYKVNKFIRGQDYVNAVLHWEKYIKIDGSELLLKHGSSYRNTKSLKNELYKSNFFSTSAMTIKTSLLKDHNGFDNSFPNSQDYELWLRMSDKIKLGIIDEVLGSYYQIDSSITQRPYWKKIKSNLRIWYLYKAKMNKKVIFIKLIKIIFSKSWINDIKYYFFGKRA